MSPEQLHILQHSLGCDKFGRGKLYRDYYCVGLTNDKTLADIQALVALGWMRPGHKINEGRDQYFHVTQLGISAMKGHSPAPPKLTRGQQRYRDFLHADCGMKFGEYLKWLHANRDRIAALST
jgi:hypothetical protein